MTISQNKKLTGKVGRLKLMIIPDVIFDKDSYEFIEDIMEDEGISEDQKNIFWEEFGKKYTDSREFRILTHKKYLVFDDKNIYRGYFDDIEHAKISINERGLCFTQIGDYDP